MVDLRRSTSMTSLTAIDDLPIDSSPVASSDSSPSPRTGSHEDADTDVDVNVAADDAPQFAPRYRVAPRHLAAVEIPAVVENIDRAVKAFGRLPSIAHTLEPSRMSLPIYLFPEDPFCLPLNSHNARTHNVLLKVTVPKRTGRRRKRGVSNLWEGDFEIEDAPASDQPSTSFRPIREKVCSVARLDKPKLLRRKLADNVTKYSVEAVGTIKHTHRFKSPADFYWDKSQSPFAQRFAEQVLPGDMEQMQHFRFEPDPVDAPYIDVIPPPVFAHTPLDFIYNYAQNPYVRATEDGGSINTTSGRQIGHLIGAEDAAPSGPQAPPDMSDPRTAEVIRRLQDTFRQRPAWTRRSLLNCLGGILRDWNELKRYLGYTAYQFKGGPWRDAVIPYGSDPRIDPKYRAYQTLMFKLTNPSPKGAGGAWQSPRKPELKQKGKGIPDKSQSHLFDGLSYQTDGKVWQVCDITDPLLRELLDNAEPRSNWDMNSGWYHGGLWAKIKTIMKTKLTAIRFGRSLTRLDFALTLAYGDETPPKGPTAVPHVPVPDLHLDDTEVGQLRGRPPLKRRRQRQQQQSLGVNAGSRGPRASVSYEPSEPSSPAQRQNVADDDERMTPEVKGAEWVMGDDEGVDGDADGEISSLDHGEDRPTEYGDHERDAYGSSRRGRTQQRRKRR